MMNKMIKLFALLFLLLDVSISFGQIKDTLDSKFSIYTNNSLEISFKYPNGWDKSDVKGSKNVLFTTTNRQYSIDPMQEIFTVVVENTVKNRNLEESMKSSLGSAQGFKLISESLELKTNKYKIDYGVITKFVELDFFGDVDEIIMKEASFMKNTMKVTLRLNYLEKEKHVFSLVFDKIINSFQFTD